MSLRRPLAPTAILLTLVFLSLASLAAAPPTPSPTPPSTPSPTKSPASLTVHEWGTFTSVAGPDGKAIRWSPLDGPDDLPCFVERHRYNSKGTLPGTVRMETPVIYFYAPDEMTVNVSVRFHQGAITEWYPRANVNPRVINATDNIGDPMFAGTAVWNNIRITPGSATPQFRDENGPSHYYLARNTEAAPVQIGEEQEKFLFYRGIGEFQPPIAASVGADDTITVTSPTGAPLGDLILFENQGGKMAYEVRQSAGEATLTPPALASGSAPPTAELEQILIAHGLFPREAKAMVDTWRDSWFEEGARLFYIAPRGAIDAILPLDITPLPTETTRVFVGRMELITAATRQDVKRALKTKNTGVLAKYGRFVSPIAWQILKPMSEPERTRLAKALDPIYKAHFDARVSRCRTPPLATH